MTHSDPRIEQIMNRIEDSGWEITIVDLKTEWWADVIIKLKSNWSTKDALAYLTLLVDPQYSDLNSRKPEHGIWAISIGSNVPRTKEDYERCWALNQIANSEKEIIGLLDSLRKTKTQQML